MDPTSPRSRLVRAGERYLKTDVRYLMSTGLWSNLGTVSVSLGSLVLYILFSRYVSKDVYGTYQYLLSVGAIVGAFTLTGMNATVTRAVAQGDEGTFWRSIIVQLTWNIVPLVGSWGLGGYYLIHGNTTLGWGLVLIGIFVPLNNTLNTYGAFLAGKQDFRRGFLYSLWWNIPYYATVAVVAIFWKAALLLLAANLISQCAGLVIAYRSTVAAYRPNKRESPEALRYGGHLSAMGLFGSIVAQTDNILAFHFLGPAELALYSFATALPDRLGALFKFIPAAALPRFSGRTPAEIRIGLGRRLLLGTLASAALALMYLVIAHPLFALLFPTYLSAVPYSELYALSLVTLMSGVLVNALTAAGNVRTLYIFNTAAPLAQLALQIVGILFFGLWGLIVARIISNLILFALAALLYWRID